MDLAYLKEHCREISKGWSDARLADFLEKRLCPDAAKHAMEFNGAEYYTKSLRAATLQGAHAWSNLAAIVYGYGRLWSGNYSFAVAYCLSRVHGNGEAGEGHASLSV